MVRTCLPASSLRFYRTFFFLLAAVPFAVSTIVSGFVAAQLTGNHLFFLALIKSGSGTALLRATSITGLISELFRLSR